MKEQKLIESVNSAIDRILYLELSSLEKERREDAYLAINEAIVALEELKDILSNASVAQLDRASDF